MAHCYFITSLAGHRIIASSTGSVNTTVPFSSGVEDGIILTAGSFAGAAQAVKEILMSLVSKPSLENRELQLVS